MLVISRKSHEFIQIGEEIIIKVIKTASGSVKIGIDAPGGMRVLRGELSDDPREWPRHPVAARRIGRSPVVCEAESPCLVESLTAVQSRL